VPFRVPSAGARRGQLGGTWRRLSTAASATDYLETVSHLGVAAATTRHIPLATFSTAPMVLDLHGSAATREYLLEYLARYGPDAGFLAAFSSGSAALATADLNKLLDTAGAASRAPCGATYPPLAAVLGRIDVTDSPRQPLVAPMSTDEQATRAGKAAQRADRTHSRADAEWERSSSHR
jgi:hypothetical protein